MSTREITPAAREDSPSFNRDLQLLNWPLVHDGWRSVMYLALTVTVSVGSGVFSKSATAGSVVAAALVLSMWRFWLPIRFRLNRYGITQSVWGRQRLIPWSMIRRYDVLQGGIVFYLATERSPLALLSSLYIDCRTQREDVEAVVRLMTGHARKIRRHNIRQP